MRDFNQTTDVRSWFSFSPIFTYIASTEWDQLRIIWKCMQVYICQIQDPSFSFKLSSLSMLNKQESVFSTFFVTEVPRDMPPKLTHN